LLISAILQAAVIAMPACTAAEHRQLDFWLGSWTVVDAATGSTAGSSRIESAFKGCSIRETFVGPDGFEGGSINLWDRNLMEWVQFGTGSTGARMQFTGHWDGKRVNLITTQVRGGRTPLLIRMRLEPHPDGTVRQWSDMSSDQGETWRIRYDYIYRRTN
jgi:hypothetical protein